MLIDLFFLVLYPGIFIFISIAARFIIILSDWLYNTTTQRAAKTFQGWQEKATAGHSAK